ncbi:MAG: alpha-tubulin suppressor [Verrucomicrobiales bacterium]|nr:alpha-tubulin suppressor [Verrucomicrobiales bacterium]
MLAVMYWKCRLGAVIVGIAGTGAGAGTALAGMPQRMPEVMIPIRMPGDPPVELPANAGTSGLPLSWEVATGPATVSGTTVTLTGQTGPVTLRATQPGNTEWDPLVGHVTFAVTEEGGYTQVSMGGEGSLGNRLALGRDGRIHGWKFTTTRGSIPGPVRTPAGVRWKGITAGGGNQPLAIKDDGSLWIWPEMFPSKFPASPGEASAPVRLGTENDWKEITAGRYSRLAIKANGTLWGWHDNAFTPPGLPALMDGRTDWVECSVSNQDYALARRVGGECYLPQFNASPQVNAYGSGLWRAASISQAGLVRVKNDATLWFSYGQDKLLSADPVWKAAACLRARYMALQEDGSVWGGVMDPGTADPPAPVKLTTGQKMTAISGGYDQGGAIAEDGSLWIRSFFGLFLASGKTPAFFPQRLDFMEAKEQPFPVVAGTVLAIPASAMSSGLPVGLSVVSGPAVITGGGISFTGPGLVEVSFQQPGDNTWAAFEEKRTFLSGAAGPEIAVHDGSSVTGPARRDAGPVIALGKHTRAEVSTGFVRTWMVENTGTLPLAISGVSPEAAGPLVFTGGFSSVTLEPGASLPLVLTFSSVEYGSHVLNVVIHSNDADEGAYRIPVSVEVANTPPMASAGPDRQVHAGSSLRLDGAFFSRDPEQLPGALLYEWDLDGHGYASAGAVTEVMLAQAGDRVVARLRVTDGDGAVSFAECVVTAVPPGLPIPGTMRLVGDGFGEFSFHGVPGRKYRVSGSLDLVIWERVDVVSGSNPPPMEPGPDGFFQAKIWVGGWDHHFFRVQEVSE